MVNGLLGWNDRYSIDLLDFYVRYELSKYSVYRLLQLHLYIYISKS